MLAARCSERCPTAVAAREAGPGIIAMASGDPIPPTIPITVAITVAPTGSSTATSAAPATSAAAPVRERRNRCQGSNR